MKTKDIICIFLLLFLIYRIMKIDTIEGNTLQGTIPRRSISR